MGERKSPDRQLIVMGGRAVYVKRLKDRRGALEILPDEVPEVCRDVKYASRTEMLAHLEQGTEPESMLLLRLQERLAAAEARAQAAEDRAAEAQDAAQAAGDGASAKLDALEGRLQSLERARREQAETEMEVEK